ncbi:DNA transposase THAP9 [Merluccius polli]|uniref:DNA transposase THAP9 n=1 Tax=Merluccius polli TaxID=89951 RepID=A0AA47MCN2_MERPO|nr:DNA transposase THAP9 [Merluccius polli]
MPAFCAAYGCNNRRSIDTRSRGITFHKFPSDTGLRRQWEVAVRREGFVVTESSRLCSEHFKPDDFDRTGQVVRLRDGATPSVFNFPSHLQRISLTRNTTTSRKAEESLPLDLSLKRFPESKPEPNDDHPYALSNSPTRLKARHSEALDRVERLEREKQNAKARERRAKKTVKSLLEDLNNNNLINEELKERLDFHSDLQIDLFSKRCQEYTKDQREFALTLHLHGPKAYSYLRDSLHLPLPHPHTLQRWMQSVDAKPGLNTMMLDMLQRRREEDPAKYGSVALMLDAMAIKRHVQYNPYTQKMSGYVDMGNGVDETDVATEVLVFMVVGIQGHWKAPVAYYLSKSPSPDTQKVLVVHALEELHARGIRVVCMTMDGHASNVSMCNQLGCQLKGNPHELLKTFFEHPVTADRVFVLMDACHMLKLARNMLQAYSPITSATGEISWYLSVIGFVINMDTLLMMIPDLLQVQRYVCTYRFSQDHLELLFNSVRASGGWNNNPTAGQFQGIFRRLMVHCGVSPSGSGNVAAQDETVSLSAADMHSALMAEEELLSPFANISAVICDHSYLPTRFGGLVDNALVYISGFVVRKILKKLSCEVCRASLVTAAVPSSFDQSYHLLELKNNGGLMMPSEGTVKVVRAAERVIRQNSKEQGVSVSFVNVFLLGEHIAETQFGIENHHFMLVSFVVSVFHKVRLHHIAKLTTLELQSASKLGDTLPLCIYVYGRYDACVDNVKKPAMFVVFDSCQCYSYYLIRFREAEKVVDIREE